MRKVVSDVALPKGLHSERIKWLYEGGAAGADTKAADLKGYHLLYWMQTSMRTRYNYALEYSIAIANALKLPIHVVYFFSDKSVAPDLSGDDATSAPKDHANAYGFATHRHASFALQGLSNVHDGLKQRGIDFQVLLHQRKQDDSSSRSDFLQQCAKNAAVVVTDRTYLRPSVESMEECVNIAESNESFWGLVQVEGDVVVPVDTASPKEEYAARTIRSKIDKQTKKFMKELPELEVDSECQTLEKPLEVDSSTTVLDVSDMERLPMDQLDVDASVKAFEGFTGGQDAAQVTLEEFISDKLKGYADDRNEPANNASSHLSPYLHYGHISPVDIALEVQHQPTSTRAGKEAFLEEMIVRRELAYNFIRYNNEHYDSLEGIPNFAKQTLKDHEDDERVTIYSLEQIEKAQTYDAYWNAAQLEVVAGGSMHGYMRMYWGKKILEWTQSPAEAFKRALYLNNKYAVDGPDPNSYTGIAWVFGKHDQGWQERPVFGKVRYMNETGLKRKFRMNDYISRVNELVKVSGINAPTIQVPASGKRSTTSKTKSSKKQKTLD